MHGARVALIGAGGGAAAVLAAAEGWGDAQVRVHNRNMTRAQQLVSRFDSIATVAPSLEETLRGAALVVNTTPVGMRDADFPVPIDLLPEGCAVFDLVYRAGETAWVTAARAAGHRSADGMGMLVEQGALAFTRWFGVEPDRGAMWRAMHGAARPRRSAAVRRRCWTSCCLACAWSAPGRCARRRTAWSAACAGCARSCCPCRSARGVDTRSTSTVP
jgi:shikimate 5-dehydrogenase